MTLEELMEPYKNVPIGPLEKMREILQQAALLGLYRTHFFKHAAFYGGTALRILYGLNRFSEDLDFSLLEKNPHFDLEPYLDGLKQEMASMGFDVSVAEKEKKQASSIVSAFLKTNTLDLLLQIQPSHKLGLIHPEQQLKVKLEIDVDPPLGFRTVSGLVKNPTPFQVNTYHLSDLFAGKMHAILFRAWKNRIKGRDWFDLIWFIQKEIPLNLNHLQSRMRHVGQDAPENAETFLKLLQERIQTIDWDMAKKDVRGFITDPRLLDPWSPSFFLSLIQHLKIEQA